MADYPFGYVEDEKPAYITEPVKRVGLDFDGVIHDYRGGWQGYGVVAGEPVPGIKEELRRLHEAGYRIDVISSRALTPEGRAAICVWLEKHELNKYITNVASRKFPCLVYFDDRGVTYRPGMDLLETVRGFTPWMNEKPIESALE